MMEGDGVTGAPSAKTPEYEVGMATSVNKVAKKTKQYEHILLVMRHAKAESAAVSDYERNLTDKGLKQAKRVAKGLREMKLVPDVIVCSAATRARQTLERMLKVFGDKPKVDYHQNLYDGGMQAVLDELAHAKDKTRVLMVLGHEPTVSISSQWLASDDSKEERLELLNLGLQTAGIVVLGSDKPFNQWQLHDGMLLAVLSPADFE